MAINLSDISLVLSKGMYPRIFPPHIETIPLLNEIYELALAFYESQILDEDEIIERGAYFARVNKKYTKHFLMCTGDSLQLPEYSSSRLKSFFQKNQFRTGYATHGLFPYRGKFHPQMIKALINVMGLKPGQTILDPMMGSGTVPIESCIMSINSIGIDSSPFCQFMTQSKIDGLTLPTEPLRNALTNYENLFNLFIDIVGSPEQGSKVRNHLKPIQRTMIKEPSAIYNSSVPEKFALITSSEKLETFNFLLLAYLDSAGYSERSKRKSPLEQFHSILERYVFVVKKIQNVINDADLNLAKSTIIAGDSRNLELDNQSIDGILFSPPYSFAIDYLKNDSFHLNALGQDITELKKKMIGLRGKNLREKYELYLDDMKKIISECSRVLKPNHFCTIIIGTNDNQLSKALEVPKEKVKGLHQVLIDIASNYSLLPVRNLSRMISGIANTMRNEFIVILQKK